MTKRSTETRRIIVITQVLSIPSMIAFALTALFASTSVGQSTTAASSPVRLERLSAVTGRDTLVAGLSRAVSAATGVETPEAILAGVSGIGFLTAVCHDGCSCRDDDECRAHLVQGLEMLGCTATCFGSAEEHPEESLGDLWPECVSALEGGVPILVNDVFVSGEPCLIVGFEPGGEGLHVVPADAGLEKMRPVTFGHLERRHPSGLLIRAHGDDVPTFDRRAALAAILRVVVDSGRPALERRCLREADPAPSEVGCRAYQLIAENIALPVPKRSGSTASPWARGKRFGDWVGRRELAIEFLKHIRPLFGEKGQRAVGSAIEAFQREIDEGLRPLGSLLPRAGTGWNDVSDQVKTKATQLVRRAMLGHEQGLAALEDLLREESGYEAALLEALLRSEPRGQEMRLAELIGGEDLDAAILAIRALGKGEKGPWVESIVSALDSERAIVVEEAVATIASVMPAEVPMRLGNAIAARAQRISTTDPDSLRVLLRAVTALEDTEAKRLLVRLGRLEIPGCDDNPIVAFADDELRRRLGRESKAMFLTNLGANDPEVRRHAAKQLAEFVDPGALTELLTNTTLEACFLRTRLGEEFGLATLIDAAARGEEASRKRAERLLIECGSRVAPRVRQMLDSTDAAARAAAVRILGAIGGRAEIDALDALIASPELGDAAKKAIEAIRRRLATEGRGIR